VFSKIGSQIGPNCLNRTDLVGLHIRRPNVIELGIHIRYQNQVLQLDAQIGPNCLNRTDLVGLHIRRPNVIELGIHIRSANRFGARIGYQNQVLQ